MLVFPAPGCTSGQQFLDLFDGFDITASNGGNFTNLLINSIDLDTLSWTKGINGNVVVGNYRTVQWYITDEPLLQHTDIYLVKIPNAGYEIWSNSNTQFFGQHVTVLPNTTYTGSISAKRGTATDVTYGIYDISNSTVLVPPTSYYNQLNSYSYSRIEFTFTTSSNCTEIMFYPFWDILGTPGSTSIFGPQLELGSSSSGFNPTYNVPYVDAGFGVTSKTQYSLTSNLSTFNDIYQTPNTVAVIGQNKSRADIVNWYINDNYILTYTSDAGNTVLEFVENAVPPFKTGDNITVYTSTYNQTYEVLQCSTTNVTLNSTNTVPIDGAMIINSVLIPASVYPKISVVVNSQPVNARENFYYFNIAPGYRADGYNTVASNSIDYILGIGTMQSVNKLIDVETVQPVSTLVSINKLKTPALVSNVNTINTFYSQSNLRITTSPVNARENLYYFNISPGKRNNKTTTFGTTFSATESDIIVPIIDAAITPVISDGIEFTVNNIRITKFPQPFMFDIPTVSNLNKDSLIVKAVLSILTAESLDKSIVSLDSDGITLTVNRIDVSKFSNNTMFETPSADPVKNISSLRSDPNTYIPDRIELSKFVNNTMFETPLSYSLSKGIFKLVDATAIKKEPIQFWN